MTIELNEQEAMRIVRALGTKAHRMEQRERWLRNNRITTLNGRKESNPDDEGINKAFQHTYQKIEMYTAEAKELLMIQTRIAEQFGIRADGKRI